MLNASQPRRVVPYIRSVRGPNRGSLVNMTKSSSTDAAITDVVVVGGGLAGLTAALETSRLSPEASIVVLEAAERVGGNSTKASSGMNILTAESGDAETDFVRDTVASGAPLTDPALAHGLVQDSLAAHRFLQSHGVNLSKTVQLGGHSHSRTHCNPSGPNVGFAIMKPLIDAATANINIRILTSSRLTDLSRTPPTITVTYAPPDDPHPDASATDKPTLRARTVIIAAGGFAGNPAAVQAYSPHLTAFPSTNAASPSAGSALAVAARFGAALVQLDQVQVHPTAFVNPADPDAHSKFLAPEALRGSGAVLLNAAGCRFVDELQTRNRVVAAIQQQGAVGGGAAGAQAGVASDVSSSTAERGGRRAGDAGGAQGGEIDMEKQGGGGDGGGVWLVLPKQGAELFGQGAIDFYAAKGLMTQHASLAAAAEQLGVPAERLRGVAAAYNAAARGEARDPLGKSVFPVELDADAAVYVARVTPALHYCMGGIKFDERARALDEVGAVVPGLFAAGEATGGLHGRNRLAGNSLLECVVFGRRAAASAVAAFGA